MTKSAASFKRGKSRFKPQPRVLIICEDIKSARNYLQDAVRHFRAYAEVSVTHCGRTDPRGIVEEAIKRKKDFDKVYCVIDRDSHESFQQALERAEQDAKVEVIPSYPCYEFWLFLHFKYSRASVMPAGDVSAGARMITILREQEGFSKYQKGGTASVFDFLLDRLDAAKANAGQALAEARRDENMNPSTRMHILIDAIEELGKVKLV